MKEMLLNNGRPEKHFSAKTMWVWIFILLIFMGEMMFYTWCRVQCIRTGYAINEELERHKRFTAIQNRLTIEAARLKSPDRISAIAGKEGKLIMPRPDQVVIVR